MAAISCHSLQLAKVTRMSKEPSQDPSRLHGAIVEDLLSSFQATWSLSRRVEHHEKASSWAAECVGGGRESGLGWNGFSRQTNMSVPSVFALMRGSFLLWERDVIL